jgi:predicted amidophosphoribosyltransferase
MLRDITSTDIFRDFDCELECFYSGVRVDTVTRIRMYELIHFRISIVNMYQWWRLSIDRALNLFLQPNCPLCDRPAVGVCCEYCQRQIYDERLERPDRYWQGDLPLFAWGKYQGAMKRSIGKFKYDGHRSIGDLYGQLLAESWQQYTPSNLPTKLVAIPIPLYPEKLLARGFNQAESIARKFCQLTGAKLDLSLHRTRSTVAQFGLSKSARYDRAINR